MALPTYTGSLHLSNDLIQNTLSVPASVKCSDFPAEWYVILLPVPVGLCLLSLFLSLLLILHVFPVAYACLVHQICLQVIFSSTYFDRVVSGKVIRQRANSLTEVSFITELKFGRPHRLPLRIKYRAIFATKA